MTLSDPYTWYTHHLVSEQNQVTTHFVLICLRIRSMTIGYSDSAKNKCLTRYDFLILAMEAVFGINNALVLYVTSTGCECSSEPGVRSELRDIVEVHVQPIHAVYVHVQ